MIFFQSKHSVLLFLKFLVQVFDFNISSAQFFSEALALLLLQINIIFGKLKLSL